MSLDSLTAPIPAKSSKTRPVRSKAITQILELQEEAHATALDPNTPIKDRSALMRAWCDLQEEKRKLQMRPLPKPVDVSKLSKGKRKPTEPAYQEPDATTGGVQPKPEK